MKKQRALLSLIIILFLTTNTQAQDFDSQLEKLAQGIAVKLDSKGKKKIAVWGFVTENGERTALGNYLTEDFSVYVTNFGEKFEVIDRNHLDILLKEHKLNSEGYIDDNTAKELGKIIAVDAIITGTYTVLNTTVKVRAKVLDTETALQFAANMASLPINEEVASYLGISVNGGNTTNKGFNTSLNSNETINNPETVDPKCKEENFGDLCLFNSTNQKMIVLIRYFRYADTTKNTKIHKTIIINPGETKCVYRFWNREIFYHVANWESFQEDFKGIETYLYNQGYYKFLKDLGELKIETCKSKTFTIK